MSRGAHCAGLFLFAQLGCVAGTAAPGESAQRLLTLFPAQASAVLGASAIDGFVDTEEGFTIVPGTNDGPRSRLMLTLPGDASDAARFELGGNVTVAVRELAARGTGRLDGAAVSYQRDNGSSFWTPVAAGYEEWLLVRPAASRDTPLASWQVEGATVRRRDDGTVELRS